MINELKRNVKKLDNLITFYKEIGVVDSFIFHIVKIVSKIGDNFFEIQQDRDLYLSLFYVFYNSMLGQGAFARRCWRVDEEDETNELQKLSLFQKREADIQPLPLHLHSPPQRTTEASEGGTPGSLQVLQ